MKEVKNKVPAAEQVEAAPQADESAKDVKEKALREETEKLKVKFSAKVNVLIEDKALREKLHEVISEAVDESVLMGQAAGVPEEMMKSVTDTFEAAARSLGCLRGPNQAETYKRLFCNQRIITAHLMSVAQLLQLQIGDTESLAAPNPLSLLGTMEKTFASPPVALERANN